LYNEEDTDDAESAELEEDPRFLQLLRGYSLFNPHATFSYASETCDVSYSLSSPDWQKWMPRSPTSPHWYTPESFRALFAAYVSEERTNGKAKTMREFVSEFHGLRRSQMQKDVLDSVGLSGALMRDLVEADDVSVARVTPLLLAMQRESRIVKPEALGIIGERHLRSCLVDHYGVNEATVSYKKVTGIENGLPFVGESAFGEFEDTSTGKVVQYGLNFAPCLTPPFLLNMERAKVEDEDPVCLVIHLTMPGLLFTDRGKSHVTLPDAVWSALSEAFLASTKQWTAWKNLSDKQQKARERKREQDLKAQQPETVSLKQAAFQAMEDAYLKASDNGRLPANARQVMYAARPLVLAATGGNCWKNSSYFTQHLLPAYLAEFPAQTRDWDIVFDDRGHFTEPHTGKRIGLGTLAVRHFRRGWHKDIDSVIDGISFGRHCDTVGPDNRYRFALYIEKEGFDPLFESARLAERFDLAIFSSKGMSTTACRQLVDELSEQGVTIPVLHDFDKPGFSIVHTLQSNTRRFQFRNTPNVIDLGLRLTDVQEMQLQSEEVEYDSGKDPRENLRDCGATEEECAFLVRGTRMKHKKAQPNNAYVKRETAVWYGERVELNAMPSRQLLDWLEAKLIAHGVQKVVPDPETLAKSYRQVALKARIERAVEEAIQHVAKDPEHITPPEDLAEQVREMITDSAQSWDNALWGIVQKQDDTDT
jgi:hypothetical protein